MISSKTKMICLMGHPVGHSKSPIIHNAELKKSKTDAVYVAVDIKPENLKQAIEGFKAMGFLGANVTIPHKQEVMNYVDELTDEAKNIGAVNTLYFEDDKLIGDNTDGRGFVISLMKDGRFDPKDKNTLILGAGGASQAVSTKLCLEGIKELFIYEINKSRGEHLKKHLEELNSGVKLSLVNLEELNEIAKKMDLIVNCTPVGMKESDPLLLDGSVFNKNQFVFDLVYNPEKTKLLEKAEESGAKIINGMGMLVYQGALSFEKWTKEKPDTNAMFKVIRGE